MFEKFFMFDPGLLRKHLASLTLVQVRGKLVLNADLEERSTFGKEVYLL